ncbi:MAG: hypothetical protein JRH10_00135 [Deltaproteobacteria bacterium]|nr:hypothetical protein [Deltaproteobacteria bacterium]MBW2444577.1 hypothetical protein [Deltaproteobacteria bacterium]
MADHESTEAAAGVPDALPLEPTDPDSGFDFWLFGLLLGVAVLVALQNLWLRRKAKAGEDEG